jgi:hypothetical protein
MKRNNLSIDMGIIDIPKAYPEFTEVQKKQLCNKIIDRLLTYIDKNLDPEINRIDFLDDVFVSSIESNKEEELYEVCIVLSDCRKLLNEA